MDRRKFLVGMGSLAAGGAAVMGTGAFNSTDIRREVSVNVADDNQAYVSFDPTSGQHSNFAH
ncbi:MAG TPA: hypothetical protein VJ898_03820, partial [Natrialbaceae archaeon]|nr:hypothetical protein [Natrialbaceae archaeon]